MLPPGVVKLPVFGRPKRADTVGQPAGSGLRHRDLRAWQCPPADTRRDDGYRARSAVSRTHHRGEGVLHFDTYVFRQCRHQLLPELLFSFRSQVNDGVLNLLP
jgi:hypothetical protein